VFHNAKKFADVKEAIVYGSVIKGRTMGSSDLDVALVIRGLEVKKLSALLVKIHLSLPEEVSEIIHIRIIDEKHEEEFLKFAGKYEIIKD
jgi:predicted nucleotidyltransferase